MAEFTGNLLDASGVACRLRVKADTVRKWVQRGLLKPRGTIGRAYLFDHSEVERFAAQKRRPGNPLLQKKR